MKFVFCSFAISAITIFALAQEVTTVESDPIKHVVVLMLENHSFDQMLGCMKEVYPEL